MNGIVNITPVIKKVNFKQAGKITLHLEDGRDISVPLRYFPAIKRLPVVERKKYIVVDNNILTFKNCNEMFPIDEFLGVYDNYKYQH